MDDIDDLMLDPVKSVYADRNAEDDIERSMSRKFLFDKIKEHDLDIQKISGKKLGNEQFHKFNIMVKDLVETGTFEMREIACFLEENFFDIRSSIKCFNEENYLILKQELLHRNPLRKRRKK